MAKARKPKKPDHLKRVLAALEAADIAPVRGIFAELHPADIARVLEGLPPEQRASVWAQVDIQHMGEVLLELSEGVRGDLVKLLWYDGQGLCLFSKRIDRGKFVWPMTQTGVAHLSAAQLSMLLEGVDWRRPERTWRPALAG